MNKEYKTHLHCLSFDVTRRCNLNCEWCLKGESENIDISTDIIDKTFDKTSEYCIHSISIFGGEPLLRPDIIVYIIDQIIERKIMTNSVILYTNGLVKDRTVKAALDKFCDYAKSIEMEFCKLCGISFADVENAEKVKIIVGHRFHNTSMDVVEEALDFYSENNKLILALREEDEPRMGGILLGGKVETNYQKFISNPVLPDVVSMNYEECYIINNYNYSKFLGKFAYDNYIRIVISVASNGNVYPGTRYSYKEIDKSPMFNILECDNFYEAVLSWCWQHPVNSNIRELRKRKMLYDWCQEHNYEIFDFTSEDEEELLALNKIADEQEKRAKAIHLEFPNLNLYQVDLLASLDIYISLKKLNANTRYIKSYLSQCTYLGTEMSFMDVEYANKYIHLILGEMEGTLSFDESLSLMFSGKQYSQEEIIQFIMEQGYSWAQAMNMYMEMAENYKKGQSLLKKSK